MAIQRPAGDQPPAFHPLPGNQYRDPEHQLPEAFGEGHGQPDLATEPHQVAEHHEAGLLYADAGRDHEATHPGGALVGLEAALRRDAAGAGSSLFSRIQLGDLYALRLNLAQIAGRLGGSEMSRQEQEM